MYNFENLNDYEFEALANDIIASRIKTRLYRQPKGPDGGIDLYDKVSNPSIIVQVKHYVNSSFSSLKYQIEKKEKNKVESLNPAKYYLIISMNLTLENKKTLMNIIPNYLIDESHIIDKLEIEDILKEPSNSTFLVKHHKLWFTDLTILEQIVQHHSFIDCEAILTEINELKPYFVETQAYYDSLNKLDKGNVLILVGNPGVGKSTISKMLLYKFASEGYKVKYITSNDIREVKNAINRNPDEKEIILIEDFLGQHYINIQETRPNEFNSLLSYIVNRPNKKLIVNSRITILNSVKNTNLVFDNLIQKYENNKYVIELDQLNRIEKAKILYNHLYFNIDREYLNQIKKNAFYFKIIDNINYNPRVIDFVTNKQRYKTKQPINYPAFIIESLNNQESVWEDEIINRLSDIDRIFLNTLYSLTDTFIEIELLKKCFNNRIQSLNFDTTKNNFNDVIRRLNESIIRIQVTETNVSKIQKIGVINPAVNDYLRYSLSNNQQEVSEILKYAKYIQQVHRILKINNENLNELFKIEYSKLPSIDYTKTVFFIFDLISEISIYNFESNFELKELFEELCKSSYPDIIKKLLIRGFLPDEFISVLLRNLKFTLIGADLFLLEIIYNEVFNNSLFTNQHEQIFIEVSIEALIDEITDTMNFEMEQIVEDYLDDKAKRVNIREELEEGFYTDIVVDVENYVYDSIDSFIESYVDNFYLELDFKAIDKSKIYEKLEVERVVNQYLFKSLETDEHNPKHQTKSEEDKLIRKMFD